MAIVVKVLALVLLLRSAVSLAAVQLDDLEESPDLGKVVELTDASIEAALNRHEYILIDFYAPWCKHCQSLSPQVFLLRS